LRHYCDLRDFDLLAWALELASEAFAVRLDFFDYCAILLDLYTTHKYILRSHSAWTTDLEDARFDVLIMVGFSDSITNGGCGHARRVRGLMANVLELNCGRVWT
jgi:hypothetical protein